MTLLNLTTDERGSFFVRSTAADKWTWKDNISAFSGGLRFVLVVLGLAMAISQSAFAAPAPAKPSATSVTATIPELVKSTFVIPTKPEEGKDPFFPKSMRVYTTMTPTNPASAPVFVPVNDLQFKGLSGTSEHKLAIINNHTFEVGEEGEVTTSGGRVSIRVVEINADSVVVLTRGQRVVLHLRRGI